MSRTTNNRLPFFQIDAFAQSPFEGNPAAVCVLSSELEDDAWAQSTAAEMNLSETAFVGPTDEASCRQLRWFTPELEVDLCGHATLAAAHALWSAGLESVDNAIQFRTRSGLLTAAPSLIEGRRIIELDFPARPIERCAAPEDLLVALGVVPRAVGKSGEDDYLIEVESVDFVLELQPDIALLKTVAGRGFIVTAAVEAEDEVKTNRNGGRPDFVSRFFAPSCGVDEDPVTGSAHCSLAPFWAARLKKDTLLGYQASQRGGFVGLEVHGDRVKLSGDAVTVVEGELLAGP